MKRNEIETLLPSVMQRTLWPTSPLFTLLQIMDDLHAPAEEVLDQLAAFFNPYQTPDEFVPYLASWVDLARFLAESPEAIQSSELPSYAPGLGQLRELIAAAAELSKWRGTRTGLVRFLETATGVVGFEVDEQVPDDQGRVRPFHMAVRAPAAALPFAPLIRRIVEQEKPAYMTAEVVFAAAT
jgi:phage tail-like protein